MLLLTELGIFCGAVATMMPRRRAITAAQRSRELTQRESRRTLDCNMTAWFYVHFAIVKKIAADFMANDKISRRFNFNTED